MTSWAKTSSILRAAAANGLPPVVAGVTTAEGTVFTESCGAALDDIFWIASMTKAVTSVAALQLVEQGLVGLDDPLEPADRQILEGFDGDGRPRLRDAIGSITLRHLLSQTSGVADDVFNADIRRYREWAGLPETYGGRRAALDLPLVAEPGSAWQYGAGHDLAGLLIEKLTSTTLDRYFQQRIFAPIGMANTGYQLAASQTLYTRAGQAGLVPTDRTLPADRDYWPGGGSLCSTVPDYLAFIRMLIKGGGDILKRDTVARLAENCTGDLAVSRLPAVPGQSNAVELLPGVRKCWGLGFMVNLEDAPTGRRAGSLAWAGLGNTYFWIDPAAGIGGVLLMQLLPFGDPAALALFDAFESSVYAALSA